MAIDRHSPRFILSKRISVVLLQKALTSESGSLTNEKLRSIASCTAVLASLIVGELESGRSRVDGELGESKESCPCGDEGRPGHPAGWCGQNLKG